MNGKKRIAIGALAAGTAAVASLLGSVFAGSDSARPAVSRQPSGVATELLQGFAPGDTAGYVQELERRVAEDGDDARSLTLLGLAYQQRARETGDPSFYPRSTEALTRALVLRPDDFLATTGLAALAASRHRFEEARKLAARAVRLNPWSAPAYGVLGDSLAELGRYRDAFAAFDRMVARKPSLSSYARVAYGRELLGQPAGAVAAMKLAVEAGASVPEHAAWALVQLGNLYFATGRPERAARAYRTALARLPGYVYAQAGLARVDAARGRTDRAIGRYRSALARVPLPEFAVALSETLHAARRADAHEADELVAALGRVLRANGVRTDVETALFDLDHGRNVADALARAREAYARAPSIHAEDVLAWGLYKNERCKEARQHSVRALRLGTRDALLHFHRGMIERCLGNVAASRAFLAEALAINPHFSLLHVPLAREALQ